MTLNIRDYLKYDCEYMILINKNEVICSNDELPDNNVCNNPKYCKHRKSMDLSIKDPPRRKK